MISPNNNMPPHHGMPSTMQGMPQVRMAILDSNTLTCLGLQQLLSDMLPMADIVVFNSIKELQAYEDQRIAHIFVASRIYFENMQYFQENHKRAIVLVNGDMAIKDVFTLNVCQNVKKLVKGIMALQHRGHSNSIAMMNSNSTAALLSPRETEVAVLLCKGYINKEVADKLNVSLSTIISHRKNIMEKLRARSLADIIIHCVTNGILSIEDL